jgi:hypothetical protein
MKIDSLGRAMTMELAAGRLAVGSGAFFATRPALRALGYGESDGSGRALAKALGARDLAIAALTVASRGDRAALRTVTLAAAALDAADTVAFALALRDPTLRRASLGGVVSAGVAAGAGFWAWRRLG